MELHFDMLRRNRPAYVLKSRLQHDFLITYMAISFVEGVADYSFAYICRASRILSSVHEGEVICICVRLIDLLMISMASLRRLGLPTPYPSTGIS